MASLPVTSHLTQCNATLHYHLDFQKPAAATAVPADVRIADELEFDDSDVTALIMKKKFKVPICVDITYYMIRPAVSVLDIAAGPNLVHTCIPLVK